MRTEPRKNQEERRTAITQRINDLTSHRWSDDKSLAVASNGVFMLAAGLPIALGSLAIAYASMNSIPRNWWMGSLSLLVFLVTSVTIPRSISCIGRPALVLRTSGISSPLFGCIPWADVSGISLQKFNFRGQVTYTLVFRLSLSNSRKYDLHWTETILWALGLGVLRRGVVAIPLKEKDGCDYPETVTATAKHLWHKATGQTRDWNPLFSDVYNQASNRLSNLVADKHLLQPVGAPSQPEALIPAEQLQVISDAKFIQREHKKVAGHLNWLITVAVIGMLVSFAWPWIKPYLT